MRRRWSPSLPPLKKLNESRFSTPWSHRHYFQSCDPSLTELQLSTDVPSSSESLSYMVRSHGSLYASSGGLPSPYTINKYDKFSSLRPLSRVQRSEEVWDNMRDDVLSILTLWKTFGDLTSEGWPRTLSIRDICGGLMKSSLIELSKKKKDSCKVY